MDALIVDVTVALVPKLRLGTHVFATLLRGLPISHPFHWRTSRQCHPKTFTTFALEARDER